MGPIAALSTNDGIDDIRRLTGKMSFDSKSAFRSFNVSDRGDIPACCAFGFTARMGARRGIVDGRGEQARVHQEIPDVGIPSVRYQRRRREKFFQVSV